MKFDDLKTGDIFVLGDTIYMRTNNSNWYEYDNVIILCGKRTGELVNFNYDDEVQIIEEILK